MAELIPGIQARIRARQRQHRPFPSVSPRWQPSVPPGPPVAQHDWRTRTPRPPVPRPQPPADKPPGRIGATTTTATTAAATAVAVSGLTFVYQAASLLDVGLVDYRRFDVATRSTGPGKLEIADVALADEGQWNIQLAKMIEVNALAVPAKRSLTYRIMRHELRLLLSFVSDLPGVLLNVSGHHVHFI